MSDLNIYRRLLLKTSAATLGSFTLPAAAMRTLDAAPEFVENSESVEYFDLEEYFSASNIYPLVKVADLVEEFIRQVRANIIQPEWIDGSSYFFSRENMPTAARGIFFNRKYELIEGGVVYVARLSRI